MGVSLLLLCFGSAAIAGAPLAMFECEKPIVELWIDEGRTVTVSRKHCIDKMEAETGGLMEFYYEYVLYEFILDAQTLHARSYVETPKEAHLIGIERDGEQRELLTVTDLNKTLVRAAQRYLRRSGKSELNWLDPGNKLNGYSRIP